MDQRGKSQYHCKLKEGTIEMNFINLCYENSKNIDAHLKRNIYICIYSVFYMKFSNK